jgi:hypothetical protein
MQRDQDDQIRPPTFTISLTNPLLSLKPKHLDTTLHQRSSLQTFPLHTGPQACGDHCRKGPRTLPARAVQNHERLRRLSKYRTHSPLPWVANHQPHPLTVAPYRRPTSRAFATTSAALVHAGRSTCKSSRPSIGNVNNSASRPRPRCRPPLARCSTRTNACVPC